MAPARLRDIFGQLGRLRQRPARPQTPDQLLLARFVEEEDEGAFATLIERHGAMVLGVCTRVLRNTHDAEDACQAAFLVLARKARSIRNNASLASWLYGVAWNVAHKLQRSLARRRTREEIAASQRATVSEPADLSWREALQLLDEELHRLPAVYRAPLVLCYLEGRTQEEAAQELGWSRGVLRGRLDRGREKLRTRLARRGVTGAATLGLATLVPALTSAAVPPPLIAATAGASVPMAAGAAVPAGISPQVIALTLQSSPFFLKTGIALVAFLVLLGVMLWPALTPRPESQPIAAASGVVPAWSEVRRFEAPDTHLWSVAFSPDGARIAAGYGGFLNTAGELRLWDAATGEVVFAVNTERSVRCVSFAPDGQSLATAEHDGLARLRDAATGAVLRTFRGHRQPLDGVAFSADGKMVATCSWDNTVKLWDSATGDEVRTLRGHQGQVFGVTFCGGGRVASGGAHRPIRIHAEATGQTVLTLRGHQGVVHWLAVAPPDRNLLATGSWDRTVKLWDTTKGKLVATLHGHDDQVLTVAFSPDGRLLASATGAWGNQPSTLHVPSPGEVVVWDVQERKARARWRLADRAFGVAFSPDGKTLATGCWDGSLSLWKDEPAGMPAAPALPGQPLDSPPKDHKVLRFVLNDEQPRQDDLLPADKVYAAEYHPTLQQGAKVVPGLLIYGPDAAECIRFEQEGLRIALPAGHPRQRAGTGVVTDFGVRGDFEVTARFEVLPESRGDLAGNPTDLQLVVVPHEPIEPDVWHKANQNRASLARELAGPNQPGRFHADATTWNLDIPRDRWGNEIFTKVELHNSERSAAVAKAGWLRLVRSGPTLYFFTGDGPDEKFTLLHRKDFGTTNLKNVRLLASTGGPGAALDVRVTDLRIRADGFVQVTESMPQPSTASKGRSWLLVVLVLAIPLVAGGAWAAWLCRRTGRSATPTEPVTATEAEPPPIMFECPGCHKRLKAKAERAGNKVKCPSCGQPVQIPAAKPGIPGSST